MRGQAGYGAIAMVLLLAAMAGAGMAVMNAETARDLALAQRRIDANVLQVLADSLARQTDLWLRAGALGVDCKRNSFTLGNGAPARLRAALKDGRLALESCDPALLGQEAAEQAYRGTGRLTAPEGCRERKVLATVALEPGACAAGKAAIAVGAAFHAKPAPAVLALAGEVPREGDDDAARKRRAALAASLLAAASTPDPVRPRAATRALLPLPPNALCESLPRAVIKETVRFAARGAHCPWGVPDPEHLRDGDFHAFTREAVAFPALTGRLVCALRAEFAAPAARFDDELFLTWGGIVLLASAGDAVQSYLPAVGAGRRFDAAALSGQRNWEGDAYCPSGATCRADRGEHPGSMALELPEPVVPELLAGTAPELAVIVSGDNNPDRDCHHDDLGISLEIETVQLPAGGSTKRAP